MADIVAAVVRSTAPATATTKDFEVAGFGTPEACIVIGGGFGVTDGTAADNLGLSFGWADGTTEQQLGIHSLSGQATATTVKFLQTSHVMRMMLSTDETTQSIVSSCSWSAWSTNGVTLNFDVVTGDQEFVTVILLKNLSNCYIGEFVSSSSGVDVTDPGFEPDLVLFMQDGTTALGTYAHAYLSIGACVNDGSDTQKGVIYTTADNELAGRVELYNTSDTTGGLAFNSSLKYKSTVSNFDGNGFTHTQSAASSSHDVYYIALQFAGQASLVDVTIPTSDPYSESSLSFTPQLGMIFLLDAPAVDTLYLDKDSMSITVFDANNCYSHAVSDEDGAGTTNSDTINSSNLRLTDGSGDVAVGTFDGFSSSGWDFTLTTAPATARTGWGLAIRAAGASGGAGAQGKFRGFHANFGRMQR